MKKSVASIVLSILLACLVGGRGDAYLSPGSLTPNPGAGGGGGSSFPLQANADFNGFKGVNSAVGTTIGDLMVFGLNHLNDLAPATGVYSMNGWKIVSLAAGSVLNDAIAFGQSGAALVDLTAYGTIDYASPPTGHMDGFSINGEYNPVAYGSDPTGAIDSVATDQAAIDAACHNSFSQAGASVVWPQGKFKHVNGPNIVACDNSISFRGAGVNATQWIGDGANHGPSLIEYQTAVPSTINPITATSLVTGNGSDFSLNWGPSVNQASHFFNIAQVWDRVVAGNDVNNPLNGLTAASIEMFLKFVPLTGATNGAIYGPFRLDNHLTAIAPTSKLAAYITYNTGGTSVLKICADTTGNPSIVGNVGGVTDPPKCVSGNITNSTIEYAQFNFDGNLHLAIGLPGGTATFVGPTASSGTLVNEQNDDFFLGQSGDDPAQFMAGQIDSFRVSNVVRNAEGSGSFTAPSTKLASDANTIVLLNNQAVVNANPNGAGVLYPMVIQSTGGFGGTGWMPVYTSPSPAAGDIATIDDMTIGPSTFINQSISQGKFTNVNFNSSFWGGYQGWSQAYNTAFTHNQFVDVGGIFKIRMDHNSFGDFTDILINSGFYQVIGSGGFDINGALYHVGSGTIVENTFIGKNGDQFSQDVLRNYSGDAEEGGCAIPIESGSALNSLIVENSAFNPAGCGNPAVLFSGVPPYHTRFENDTIIGTIQFDTLLNSSVAGLPPDPVLLINDNDGTNAIGEASTSICSNSMACHIIGGNTQFSRLAIQIGPPTVVADSGNNNTGSVTSMTVPRIQHAQSGDVYIMEMSNFSADPGAYTVPTGWTQVTGSCSVADTSLGNPTTVYTHTFWHVANAPADPNNWTFAWTNATGQNKILSTLVRGADTSNPIDTCFSVHGNSTTTVTLTGGTSTNINDLVLNYIGVYTGTGTVPSVGASPPTGLAQIVNGGANANYAWYYTPASLTIPTVNYVLANSGQPFTALQIAVRSKTQSSNVLLNTASAGVVFEGESNVNITLAGPLGPFSNVTNITHANSPYSVVATDYFIGCDATAGAVTINLPAAAISKRQLIIKKMDSSANACTITRAGADLIDGATTAVDGSQYQSFSLFDGPVAATWSIF